MASLPAILNLVLLLFICILQCIFGDVSSTPHVCKDNGKCFTVIAEQRLSWDHAEEYCEKYFPNGRLASLHNAFESAMFASWLLTLSTNPWIGAFRFGSIGFVWTDGTNFTLYNNWSPGQPSDHCAQICRTTTETCQQGKWTTADCSSNLSQFICEYGNSNEMGHASCPDQWTLFPATLACYRTFLNTTSWDAAEATCQSNGGHLTSIHSDAENTFLGDLASDHSGNEYFANQTFIGMQDVNHNRTWSWSDSSSVNYFNWAPGEPNNGVSEFCVEIWEAGDTTVKYHWNDTPCNENMRAFICKRDPIWN